MSGGTFKKIMAGAVGVVAAIGLTVAVVPTASAEDFPVAKASLSADRSAPFTLSEVSIVKGTKLFIFADAPDASTVTFILDGKVRRTENSAPFDLAGGTATKAKAFNSSGLTVGRHLLTLEATFPSGNTFSVDYRFTLVDPPAPTGARVSVSLEADRSPAANLAAGADNRANPIVANFTSSDVLFVTADVPGASKVAFALDGRTGKTDSTAPFDLAGGTVALADPFALTKLSLGQHTVKATVTYPSGAKAVLTATFTVSTFPRDVDGDGLNDGSEAGYGTDPFKPDTDDDGLTDTQEIDSYGTDPVSSDTDGDGFTDGAEVTNNTDPLDADDPAPAPAP